ncbi:hypothetical protein OH76DRAFT_1268341 [Lentinus brumalis]|uniref:Uncharacterized protein n=1 Tax=Lentinus brumalis TaxID=2498619 RepID=A0A371CR62_9APHY|nr:hypothetical protein OH76DRAFT_1268341 [Polyporus brumalis]
MPPTILNTQRGAHDHTLWPVSESRGWTRDGLSGSSCDTNTLMSGIEVRTTCRPAKRIQVSLILPSRDACAAAAWISAGQPSLRGRLVRVSAPLPVLQNPHAK